MNVKHQNMNQINFKALMILPLGIIGLIITVFLMWSGKNSNPDALLPDIAISSVLIVITALSASIVRKLYPTKEKITGDTIGVSYVLTMALIAYFSWPDAFFAIALLFGSIYALPTIIPFSFFWVELYRQSKITARKSN